MSSEKRVKRIWYSRDMYTEVGDECFYGKITEIKAISNPISDAVIMMFEVYCGDKLAFEIPSIYVIEAEIVKGMSMTMETSSMACHQFEV